MTILETSPEATGLRERKKQQTRITIHETALRLIDEQGLDATTVEQICREADVSSRTFFNYFPSKAAAALQLQEATIDPAVEAAFGSARGTLVMALCDVIGNTADRGPSMIGVKPLLGRHPELMPTATQMMLEAREMFITVALQRSRDRAQAELAVTLVMAAFSRIMRDGSNSDTPLAEQLKATVEQILALGLEEMPS